MLVYVICYAASMAAAAGGRYILSGLSLMVAALYLYLRDCQRTGDPLNAAGIFSLSFVGGEGVSCLKLSRLQVPWELKTWACFFIALTAFRAAYHFAGEYLSGKEKAGGRYLPEAGKPKARSGDTVQEMGKRDAVSASSGTRDAAFVFIVLLTLVSLAAFLLEAAVLGYVPLFTYGVPHAYSYFHISGVHYFTVSCVLVPSAAVIWHFYGKERGGHGEKRNAGVVAAAVAVSLAIPLLCVSRFQLIFAVILACLTYMIMSGRERLRYVLCAGAALVPFYILLTVARSHSVSYLNGIFEMKDAGTPIFITQPYMYIANNYDNFNCLVRELPGYALGMKGLFPVWALTGLKFIKPELAAYPLYVTKEELTTLTLFYDAYYDFGVFGVLLFSAALGAASSWLSKRQGERGNPAWKLLYAQVLLYLALSFFTTWFSNPTTWFYFAVTGAFAVFIKTDRAGLMRKGPGKKSRATAHSRV